MTDIHIYIGEDAIAHLVQYCEAHQINHFLLVADRNTDAALGKSVAAALESRNWDVRSMVFDSPEVVPDEVFITQVLLRADQVERTYLAV